MRQIFFGVIIISILTNCSEKEGPTIDEEIQKLSDPPQIFTITSDKANTIKAKNGTSVIIRPNTFVFNDGQDVKESIQIELKEVFEKPDMVLNGLGTVSDGRLLESFGMIYLKATADGKELKIKDNNSITVSIPNKREGYGELFYGVQTDRALNWKYAGSTPDTTAVIETEMPMSNGLASVKRTTYRFVDGLKEFVSDTLFTRKYECCYDSVSESAGYISEAYEFEVTKLGWINCDRFIDVVDKIDIVINLKDYSQPIGYIVFSDINSVIGILFDGEGQAFVNNLPNDYLVDIIILDKIKDNSMWTKQSLKIGTTNTLTLETTKINADELKTELKKLDQ